MCDLKDPVSPAGGRDKTSSHTFVITLPMQGGSAYRVGTKEND